MLSQHGDKKKRFAERYNKVQVMRTEASSVVQEHAEAFLSQCAENVGRSVDIYVRYLSRLFSTGIEVVAHTYPTSTGPPSLLRLGRNHRAPLPSSWHPLYHRSERPRDDEGVVLLDLAEE